MVGCYDCCNKKHMLADKVATGGKKKAAGLTGAPKSPPLLGKPSIDRTAVSSYCTKSEGRESERVQIPPKVVLDVTRKALRGRVKCRKAGYRAPAAKTPPKPRASPAAPPIEPPLSVSLYSQQES